MVVGFAVLLPLPPQDLPRKAECADLYFYHAAGCTVLSYFDLSQDTALQGSSTPFKLRSSVAMPSSYLQLKQPPWRYIASGAAFVAVFFVLFGFYYNRDSAPRVTITGAKGGKNLGLVDHVFNATLGVC